MKNTKTRIYKATADIPWGNIIITAVDSNSSILLPFPSRGAEYCDEHVCVRVCLSNREHISWTPRLIFIKFLCVLLMAVARSSSGGAAIRYVFPALWMALCFHIMGHTVRRVGNIDVGWCRAVQRSHKFPTYSPGALCCAVCLCCPIQCCQCTPWAKSAVDDCLVENTQQKTCPRTVDNDCSFL